MSHTLDQLADCLFLHDRTAAKVQVGTNTPWVRLRIRVKNVRLVNPKLALRGLTPGIVLVVGSLLLHFYNLECSIVIHPVQIVRRISFASLVA